MTADAETTTAVLAPPDDGVAALPHEDPPADHPAHEPPAAAEAAPTAPVDDIPPPEAAPAEAPAAEVPPPPPENKKKWYVVKVQSGREDTIRVALDKKVKINALEEFYGRVVVPVEKVTIVRDGKRVIKKNKKFPGYIFAEVEYNDQIIGLFRETSGVGDFVGATLHKAPNPMTDREVRQMLEGQDEVPGEAAPKEADGKTTVVLSFQVGDRVKVREGPFAGQEGEVKTIDDHFGSPKIKVAVQFWGRPVDVDVDYWQVDRV